MALSTEELATLAGALPDLRLALASGALEVTYDGKTIRYRSVIELRAIIRQLEDWVAGADAPRRPTFALARFSRGR